MNWSDEAEVQELSETELMHYDESDYIWYLQGGFQVRRSVYRSKVRDNI